MPDPIDPHDDLPGPWEAVLSGDSGYVIDLDELRDHRHVEVAVVRGTALPVEDGEDRRRPGSWTTDDILIELDDFDSDDDVATAFTRAQRLAAVLNATAGIPTADLVDLRHIVDLGPDGWTIKHPLACRVRDLFACPVQTAASRVIFASGANGQYECSVDDAGTFVIGNHIEVRS